MSAELLQAGDEDVQFVVERRLADGHKVRRDDRQVARVLLQTVMTKRQTESSEIFMPADES